MPNVVNITDLSRAAVTYNNVLRELPFFTFNEVSGALKLRVLKVQGEDKQISKRRKAGILRPYVPGLTLGNQQELTKFFESSLKPELVYAEIKDNITNYTDKKVISNAGEMLDNKSKKHPLELLILKDVVISFVEDVIFCMYFAERDTVTASPMTSFNGFFTKLDLLVTAGEIDAAKGNLVTTGAFDSSASAGTGSDGTNNYIRLVDFVKSGHPLLRRGPVILEASETVLTAAREGLQQLTNYFSRPTTEEMLDKLRSEANAPGLQIASHEALGTGSKITLRKPEMYDFGVMDIADQNFVQVRNPYPDPNEVQFWIQSAYDTRIIDIDRKVFLTNEQTNTAQSLAGDYENETPAVPEEPAEPENT
jgi:hypothetical protein